jgi:hypothetical protein
VTDYAYVLTAMGGAALTFAIRVEGRVWPVVDALALGCWAAAGGPRLSRAIISVAACAAIASDKLRGKKRFRLTGAPPVEIQ